MFLYCVTGIENKSEQYQLNYKNKKSQRVKLLVVQWFI